MSLHDSRQPSESFPLFELLACHPVCIHPTLPTSRAPCNNPCCRLRRSPISAKPLQVRHTAFACSISPLASVDDQIISLFIRLVRIIPASFATSEQLLVRRRLSLCHARPYTSPACPPSALPSVRPSVLQSSF